MKHLQLTQSTNPVNPLDGLPYVFYNPNINKVWIYLGLNWILEDGSWNMDYQWANNGVWKMLCNYDMLQSTAAPIIDSGIYRNEYTKTMLENPEFKNVIIDSEEHILYGEYKDGVKYSPDLTGEYNDDGVPFSKIVDYIIKR